MAVGAGDLPQRLKALRVRNTAGDNPRDDGTVTLAHRIDASEKLTSSAAAKKDNTDQEKIAQQRKDEKCKHHRSDVFNQKWHNTRDRDPVPLAPVFLQGADPSQAAISPPHVQVIGC